MISIMILERPVACPRCGAITIRLVQTGGGKGVTLRCCSDCHVGAMRPRPALVEAMWQICR